MPGARVRVAFLTPEFPTEYPSRGGLSIYLGRATRALASLGHEPEVFTVTSSRPAVQFWNGVRVESVRPERSVPLAALGRLSSVLTLTDIRWTCGFVRGAVALARAFRARHAEFPFSVVQSSDYGFTGLCLSRELQVRHVVRCSWAGDVFLRQDGRYGLEPWLMGVLERRSIRRADAAYAPSRFLSDLYRSRYGISLGVVRPPLLQEPAPAAEVGFALPKRFLLFFGHIGPRKGTDTLAAALKLAWQGEPGLMMVWAGYETRPGEFLKYGSLWADRASQVLYLGGVPRPELFAIVQHAECSVLPSRLDNLPNTALESLLLGTAVIGTAGTSLDEIIDSERSGAIVPPGDPVALSDALVRAWRGEMPWQRAGFVAPRILDELSPASAVHRLLEFAQVVH